MNISAKHIWFHRPKPFAQALALALLVALSVGVLSQFTHSHDRRSGTRRDFLKEVVGATNLSTASAIESTDKESSSKSTSDGECLICQLHQNLSVTLFSYPPSVRVAEIRCSHAPADLISYLSQLDAPRQGRAPPLNL